MPNYRKVVIFFIVGAALPSLAFAAEENPCDLGAKEVTLSVGQAKSAGAFTIRLDGADFKKDDPDQYQISVKKAGTEILLANHRLVVQNQSVLLKTTCGDLTIGANRSTYGGANVVFSLSLF